MAAAGASTSAPAYRYWRIYVQINDGDATYMSLAEIELRGSIGGADLTTSSTPTTQSSLFSGYPASNTVDNNTSQSSIWLNNYTDPPVNHWCRYDLGSPQTVAQVAMYPQSDALPRAPKDFIIQGSSDGTSFTDVKAFTGITNWDAAWRTFDL